MYYLQLLPAKAVGFLEYLAHLTKFGAPFNVPGLLKLDLALRVHYIKHSYWNWDQNNFTIYCTFDLLSRDPENIILGQQVMPYKPHYKPPKLRQQQQFQLSFRKPQTAQVPSFQPTLPQEASNFGYNPPAQQFQSQTSTSPSVAQQNTNITNWSPPLRCANGFCLLTLCECSCQCGHIYV